MTDLSAFTKTLATAATADDIRATKTALRRHHADFAALGVERRCAALLAAAELLRDHGGAVGIYLDRHVAPSAGLSAEMVRWTTARLFGDLLQSGLTEAVRSRLDGGRGRRAVRPRSCELMSAGNIFTACLQPIALAIGLGIPVFCKPASGQAAFPSLLQWALAEVDREVAPILQIARFSRHDPDCLTAFFEGSDLVIGYGDDETMRLLRRRTGPATRLVEHGHGISCAYVDAQALSDPSAADGLAMDIALYDQHGCLSPQLVWLDAGALPSARRDFLHRLDKALSSVQRVLPRGPLGAGTAAAQMQWRAVAAIEGELIEKPDHAIAYGTRSRLQPGPQSRNILVCDCHGPDDLAEQISGFGVHLKQIGIAGDAQAASTLLKALGPNLAPRLCALGSMQTPAFAGFCEGLDPASGMLKWIEIAVPC